MKARKTAQVRKRSAPLLSNVRSAISNGSALFLGDVDQRSAFARRYRDVLAAHVADFGGPDNISEAERSLIRRATTITVALERLEAKFAENDGDASAKDLLLYQRSAGALRRILQTLGLGRRAKDVTPPHPLDYAKRYALANAEDAEEVTA
jgi:hypothetical protein